MGACTLCGNHVIFRLRAEQDKRIYYSCDQCQLIFVDPGMYLSRDEEKERYLQHNNGIDQPGYVRFLNRIIEPTLDFLKPGMTGLDYGCGPVPTLSRLLARAGITCYDYDPLFQKEHPLEAYDFIFATECFEHFFKPALEIRKIVELLKPAGYLCIMTERYENVERFRTWYYKRDPTHVSFYHWNTFLFISRQFGFDIQYHDRNRVIILKNKL